MQPSNVPLRTVLPAWLAVSVATAAFAGGGVGGYAIYEHRMAQKAMAQQQQMNAELNQARAQLNQTRTEIDQLTIKVYELAARAEPQPAPAPAPAVETPVAHTTAHATVASRRPTENLRLKKMQSQLDQQDKTIADTRSQLESTRGDLSNTRSELTGSIARTHDEIVLLQKKGEHNYYEFDIAKSKAFQREGPLSVRLRKANTKHQFADLDLIVEDRNLSQKHVNLYQPAMFYTPDSTQPAELVINNISQDHIHGYVSSPKFRKSELASIPDASRAGVNQSGESKAEQSAQRQSLPRPQ